MLKRISKFPQGNKYLILIILLASVLRFVIIADNPPSLNWDEVSHGYNAYSILKTGRDEWGEFLPIIFKAYGDYKLPVYIYLTSLSIGFFGLNAFAIRLPSVLAGIAMVLFTYLLTKRLFNKRTGFVAALLVAVEPWSFFLSRGAFEANLALAFIVAGVYLFLKGLRATNYILPATILFGLSVWTYNSARVFVPILLIALVYLYRKDLLKVYGQRKNIIHYSLFIILLFLVPMLFQLASSAGQARYGWVSILDQGAIAQINEARAASQLSPVLARLVHNKGVYFLQKFISNWYSHFSPEFLFFSGGSHYQFSLPDHGLIYLINSAFLLVGLLSLIKRKNRASWLVLAWLLLAPVPSSLTRGAPHVLRAITVLPVPMIITAIGLTTVVSWLAEKLPVFGPKTEKIALIVYLFILAAFTESYLTEYFTIYKKDYSWSWQYGYQEVVSYAREHYRDYDKIIVTKKYGEPHEFFLFYWPWDPKAYQEDENLIRFYQSNWYWVDRFDKFYFVNDWQIPHARDEDFVLESGENVECFAFAEASADKQMSNTKCLLVTSPENAPDGWNRLKTINFLDGKPAFEIYEN
jgi:4-amino-4-deoxy-L-arabinose transferase-like glycosyltransferase